MSKKERQANRDERKANRKPFKDTAVGVLEISLVLEDWIK